MTIKEMTLSEKSLIGGGQGVVFNQIINLSGDVTSDAYSIPEINVNSIGVVVGGDDGLADIYATLSSPADIEDDTAIWEKWDGFSLFNNAITALYADNPSGDSKVVVSVRGLI